MASRFYLFSRPLSGMGPVRRGTGGKKEGEPAGGEVGAGSPFMPQGSEIATRLLHNRKSRPVHSRGNSETLSRRLPLARVSRAPPSPPIACPAGLGIGVVVI
jgi:hypothetical protein